MPTKLERIEARLTSDERRKIELAAAMTGMGLSTFLVRAADRWADEVIAAEGTTVVPAEWFDRLVSALDEPDEAPRLAAAVKRARA